jgi:hypothetical protein
VSLPPPGLAFAFDARIAVAPPCSVGPTRTGERRVIAITGGTVAGPGLSGRVLPGGADFQTIEADGLTLVHARYVIKAADGALVYVENTGLRFGPRGRCAEGRDGAVHIRDQLAQLRNRHGIVRHVGGHDLGGKPDRLG